jgi:hypothetical protein
MVEARLYIVAKSDRIVQPGGARIAATLFFLLKERFSMKKVLTVAFTVLVAASLSFAQRGATAGKARGGKGAPNNSSTREPKGETSNKSSNSSTREPRGETSNKSSNSSTREPRGETSNKSSNSSTREPKGETSNKSSNSSTTEHKGGKKGKKAGSDTAKGWNQKPNTRK